MILSLLNRLPRFKKLEIALFEKSAPWTDRKFFFNCLRFSAATWLLVDWLQKLHRFGLTANDFYVRARWMATFYCISRIATILSFSKSHHTTSTHLYLVRIIFRSSPFWTKIHENSKTFLRPRSTRAYVFIAFHEWLRCSAFQRATRAPAHVYLGPNNVLNFAPLTDSIQYCICIYNAYDWPLYASYSNSWAVRFLRSESRWTL